MKNRSKLIVVICAIGIISKEAITFNIYAEESEGKLNNNNSIEIKSNEDTKKIESQLPELDANKELDIESPKVNTNDLSDVESTKPGVNQVIKTDNYENKNLDKLLIEESNLYPRLWLESPREKIINKDVEVKGWALNASGVNEVKVYIDNQYINNAKVGMYRPDVDGVYPGYKDGKNSGFELIIDKNDISSGMHTVKVEAIGNDGSKHVEELPIEVEKPQPRAWIEEPSGNVMLGSEKGLQISGWALNASGVKKIEVYMDGNYVDDASIGIYRPDVNTAYPGYINGDYSGFRYILDVSKVLYGTHEISIKVIGNDDSVSNCKTTINDAKVIEKQYLSYTFEKQVEEQIKKNTDMKFIRVDGQTKYVKATESDIKYYMDYNNFKNSKDIYQFLKIDTYRNMKDTNTINNYLKSVLKDYENNPLKNQGEGFVEAARKYNIDPIYLIAHTFLETGYGSSNLAKGYEVILDENNNAIYYDKIIDGKTYKFVKIKDKNTPEGTKTIKVYNFFGIGAIDSAPVDGGVTTAYKNGWTSPRLGIEGAAKWISEGYIHRPKFNQNTLYDMRWYYSYENGNWHQYATDINWAKSISGLMYKMEHLYDLQKVNMTYKIPEYKTEYIKSFIYNIFNKK
ncbi:Beta-N-acetylglucosaminidase precursor [uncultured Clostridium sp.]|nr:Beta-N-acetylglucosaminidase precursor [uncultured Clostridium sp.]